MLRNNLKKKILPAVFTVLFILPLVAAAQVANPPAGNPGIQNPIGAKTITDLITNIITFLLGLVGLLAMLALIVGGLYMILGFANEDYVKHGKNIIKWAIIGLVVVLISYAIVITVGRLIF